MRLAALLTASLATVATASPLARWGGSKAVKPKIVIISMFEYEEVWGPLNLSVNYTLPGLSPLYPAVHCDKKGEVCQMTTGEAEINAAVSVTAMLLSDKFDFTSSYFLIGGIAGVNPYMGTLGSVGLARYAVQVALAYELDARDMPANWTTGYWVQGTAQPGTLSGANYYGTELFELNTNLRTRAKALIDAASVTLNDSDTAAAYRLTYDYAPANEPPAVFYGDVSTSDVYFAGTSLCEAFGNITSLWTNGTGQYALTAQEDNATFEAMVRAHHAGLVDYSRVILMRTASDFDRAPPGVGPYEGFMADQGGFMPAVHNIYIAGAPIVAGILKGWDKEFKKGVTPQDGFWYGADDLHTLATTTHIKRDRHLTPRGK